MEEHMTDEMRETLAEEQAEDAPLAALDTEAEPLADDEANRQAEETIEVEFSVEGIGEPQDTDRGDEEQDSSAEDDAGQEASDDTDTEVFENGSQPAEDTEETPTVESVIEAILFASEEPLSDSRLADIVETTSKQVRDCIESLNEKYERNHNAFRIEQIAGGHQMLTLPAYNTWLKKMLKVRSDNKLSPAAMETLAIIAYKQPVIRVDIEAIRGVAVGEVIRSLMYKGLVKIVGRAEILGRPMLYGTTKKFLEVFGLNSLKDLPKAEELKKPD
jgi:segregation and condensation protein B